MSELERLRAELEQIKEKMLYIEALYGIPSDNAIVGAEYVARLINCSEESVVRGRFGTDKLRRFREKPVGFVKKEVDAWHREMIKPKSEKAAEIRRNTKLIRRKR